MEGLKPRVTDSTLKHLVRLSCNGCGRLLMRISINALRPETVIEVKCPKCDFFTYEIGKTT